MQVRSMSPEQRKHIVERFGIANFVAAGVLFGFGFVLMLTSSDPFMAHDAALILMTAGAIDLCFAAAFSTGDVPPAEKTRLRALSIMGAIVVVVAATLLASHFRAGTFEIVLMLLAIGGAPGMYKLGEIVGAKFRSAAASASQSTPKAPKAPESSEGSGSAA